MKKKFNPDPSKQATVVLFSCKKVSPSHPQLTFNGTVIKKVNEQKHLGHILDSGLSLKKHLDEKIIKKISYNCIYADMFPLIMLATERLLSQQ